MQKDVRFQLEEAIEIPKWADAYPEHKFTVFKCCFLSTKPNSHELDISADVLKENANTILGNFLVAKVEFGDATTHKESEIIYGYFPIEQEIEFVEDGDVVKAYAYAVVSKRYSKEFNGIFEFDNMRNSSVEMTVEMPEDDEHKVDSFDIYGLTCLGKSVNGSCPDADIQMVRFAQEDAEDYYHIGTNAVNALQKFVQEREKSMAKYKIDKSKEVMSEKAWGDVDKEDLKDKIMEADNKAELVKACYMFVEDGWEDAPSEHLKYPVMCFEDDTLVYNRYGLASALAYAKQEDETSVINKVEKIYKDLDLDDSDGKEEKKMSEIEFAAVKIDDLWSAVYRGMRDAREWDYYIHGIYEEGGQKFAIVYDDNNKLYRLDFSLTEEGLTLADEIIEVKEEFVETENMKKFAEPENVADYRFAEAEEEPKQEKEEDEEEEKVEMSADELMEKIAKLESDIEERDNIIMGKDEEIANRDAELEELRKFKSDVEEKEKAQIVESVLTDVANCLSDEQLGQFREEGLACVMSEIDGWSNKVKAVSFEASKNKNKKKENNGIWSFSAPIQSQKKNGLWD